MGPSWYYYASFALIRENAHTNSLSVAVPQPLEQLLVSQTTITVATRHNDLITSFNFREGWPAPFTKLGVDPSLSFMAQSPLYDLVKIVRQDLAAASGLEIDPYLWKIPLELKDDLDISATYLKNQNMKTGPALKKQLFAAVGLPSGATTGAMREHAVQFNSSIGCRRLKREVFPKTCLGNLTLSGKYIKQLNRKTLGIEICAPGDDVYPWSNSRDAETISEELWVALSGLPFSSNLAMYCKVLSTRGYFELGNQFNHNQPQPLLKQWPSPEAMENFDDYDSTMWMSRGPDTKLMTSR